MSILSSIKPFLSLGLLPGLLLAEGILTASAAAQYFTGSLHMDAAVEVELDTVKDNYNFIQNPQRQLDKLPPFQFQFLQIEDAIVPIQRGPQPGDHPHWEYLLEEGSIESLATGYRILLPLNLQETDSNCIHNGLLTLATSKQFQIRNAHYEIQGETCAYLQFNLATNLPLRFEAEAVADSAEVYTSQQKLQRSRLAVSNFDTLSQRYPNIDITAFSGQPVVQHNSISTSGLVIDDIHYSGGCPQRGDDYRLCEQLSVPSYSLAKSLVAGLGLMALEKKIPGASQQLIAELVPACADWGDATLEDALNMQTGRFETTSPYADEDSSAMVEGLFLAQAHRDKINFSCQGWPQQSSPGSTWVYHSSDSYVLGTAMNALLRKQDDAADFYRDLLQPLWRELGLSPDTQYTRRTPDAAVQPFTGYGLTLLPDDLVRLGRALNKAYFSDHVDSEMLAQALQQSDPQESIAAGEKLWYRHGFWALDVQHLLNCEAPTRVPFMSGFGGINLVLLPNDMVYYMVSDGGRFNIANSIIEADKIRPFCHKRAQT